MSSISNLPPRSHAQANRDLDHIEGLIQRRRAASSPLEALRDERQLEKAQAREIRRFCRALGLSPYPVLGSPRNWTVQVLRHAAIWCELCGESCGRSDNGHGRGFAVHEGFRKAGRPHQLAAVLVHTTWNLERVEAFAHQFNLHVRVAGWSWWGPEFRAALITRNDQ